MEVRKHQVEELVGFKDRRELLRNHIQRLELKRTPVGGSRGRVQTLSDELVVTDQLTAMVIPDLRDRRSSLREQFIERLDHIEALGRRDRTAYMRARTATQLTVQIKARRESRRRMLGQGQGVQLRG